MGFQSFLEALYAWSRVQTKSNRVSISRGSSEEFDDMSLSPVYLQSPGALDQLCPST